MDFYDSLDTELIVTVSAVVVAGMAAILGIWMERDSTKPPRYAWALSALILLATMVSLMQSMLDKREQDKIKDDMARMLATMDKIASESNDPALLDLVKSEISAQSRDNPDVVEKVAERVVADGRDAEEMLGKHLDAADAEKVARKASSKPRESKPKDDDGDKEKDGDAKEGRHAAGGPARLSEEEQQRRAAAAAAAAAMGARPGRIAPGMVPQPGAAVTPGAVPVPTPTPGEPGVEAVAAPPPPAAGAVRGAGPRKPGGPTRPGARSKPSAKKPTPRKPSGK